MDNIDQKKDILVPKKPVGIIKMFTPKLLDKHNFRSINMI